MVLGEQRRSKAIQYSVYNISDSFSFVFCFRSAAATRSVAPSLIPRRRPRKQRGSKTIQFRSAAASQWRTQFLCKLQLPRRYCLQGARFQDDIARALKACDPELRSMLRFRMLFSSAIVALQLILLKILILIRRFVSRKCEAYRTLHFQFPQSFDRPVNEKND